MHVQTHPSKHARTIGCTLAHRVRRPAEHIPHPPTHARAHTHTHTPPPAQIDRMPTPERGLLGSCGM